MYINYNDRIKTPLLLYNATPIIGIKPTKPSLINIPPSSMDAYRCMEQVKLSNESSVFPKWLRDFLSANKSVSLVLVMFCWTRGV